MSKRPISDFLNPEQVEAATHGEGPQLVLAGAGSGKTRVITYRIAWLVSERGVDPYTITAVTFTNKAAAEMRQRVEELLGLYPLPTFVGTFHRWALVALRRYGERIGVNRDFVIFDGDDQVKMVKQALADEGLSEKSFAPRAVLGAISSAKNRLLDPDAYEAQADNYFARKVATVYRRYQGLLGKASAVDFDDMIGHAVKLMREHDDVLDRLRSRAHYLMVDEFQDTNHAQLALVRLLAGDDGNLTAVGDEDQGIYRWRGAELDNILRFEDSFPGATVRKLEQNYRSTQSILDAAGGLIEKNEGRRGKTLWTDRDGGETAELYRAEDEGDEARWIVNTLGDLRRDGMLLADMAILVRTNAQTRALEEELLRQEVPYVLVGGTRFYERAEIKDLVAYLRVLRNPRDEFSLLRILNQPPRGIGKATIELLHQEAEDQGQPLWDLLYQRQLGAFSTRAANALEGFRDVIVGLQKAADELPLPALLDRLLDQTGYADLYDKDDPDAQSRLENIGEFLSAAQEFTEERGAGAKAAEEVDDLTAFLDHVSLVADLDTWSADRGVAVMTLHSAKGLEFKTVFVGGLEDGLLPHFNAQGGREDIEEERRLLYVGMTRAEERLFLSSCRRRRIAGRYQDQMESPFVAEIPPDLLSVHESPSLFRSPRAAGVYSFFGKKGRGADRTFGEQVADSMGEDGLGRGARVRHPSLGEGVVLALEGDGDQAKYTVFFNRGGKRKLLAKYADLEKL
ncbi:MAG TPA: UvrD-helicase domain-containing protein [Thermoanaerobaculia bacterium]|nr:UvrD-helicase domain-containing protein [Thermoanaerobaculia bacterium]